METWPIEKYNIVLLSVAAFMFLVAVVIFILTQPEGKKIINKIRSLF